MECHKKLLVWRCREKKPLWWTLGSLQPISRGAYTCSFVGLRKANPLPLKTRKITYTSLFGDTSTQNAGSFTCSFVRFPATLWYWAPVSKASVSIVLSEMTSLPPFDGEISVCAKLSSDIVLMWLRHRHADVLNFEGIIASAIKTGIAEWATHHSLKHHVNFEDALVVLARAMSMVALDWLVAKQPVWYLGLTKAAIVGRFVQYCLH